VTAGTVMDRRSEWIRSPRRLRVVFSGEVVADSVEMMLLRQHGFLPVYYFPADDVRADLLVASPHTTYSPYKGTAAYFDVRVGDRVAPAAAWTYQDPKPGSPPTAGYFSYHWHAMDSWFEEDEPVFVHARDPYLRADTLSSSRHVVVRLHGEVVAETDRPVLLLETGLVTRYYIPPADVRRRLFEPSWSYSMCPYKGTARYRTFVGRGGRVEDAAWYYPEPLRDVLKIANHFCFWNERSSTSIEVDGTEVARPGLRRSAPGAELLSPSRRFFAVPPPDSMLQAGPGELQHDFARPNGRVEGPPDDLIDMEVERTGGRRPSSVRRLLPATSAVAAGEAAEAGAEAAEAGAEAAEASSERAGQAGDPAEPASERAETSLFFTFRRSRSATAQAPATPEARIDMAEPVDLAPPSVAPVCERALRRVRAVAGGTTVADSRDAVLYVGQDGVPVYFFPAADVRRDLLAESSTGAGVTFFALEAGSQAAEWRSDAAWSLGDPPAELDALRGRIAVRWEAADAWFEEDDQVRGHPRVPYHRVDAMISGRLVAVHLGGRQLAESRRCVALFETGQPARFYLPRLDAEIGLLVDSGRRSQSPYLGEAHWYSALIDEVVHPHVAWSYRAPIPECPKIADLLCFNESCVEVSVDPPAY
jgi:uncharacterized protein (DUF427 family)